MANTMINELNKVCLLLMKGQFFLHFSVVLMTVIKSERPWPEILQNLVTSTPTTHTHLCTGLRPSRSQVNAKMHFSGKQCIQTLKFYKSSTSVVAVFSIKHYLLLRRQSVA
jgi:hypothetical protein